MSMQKVAIPLFGEIISPRCEYAEHLLLAEIDNGEMLSRRTIELKNQDPLKKMNQIKDQGINALVCCGMAGFFLRMLEADGIHIICSTKFDVEEVLENIIKGENPSASGSCGMRGCYRENRDSNKS